VTLKTIKTEERLWSNSELNFKILVTHLQ